ncbi:uncharacterized protein UV8b_03148 [Ustilaginoidea virens]|uniref:Ribonucleases P/MRP subunit Pop8-like domain-containing protein n=1 Tax=Ustilaginoidea virens TaxID=1159556 RepID=A0A063C195_USTVR|nr:uncharacterized protein UV8b_03148 [Ustilaginoidea virens]QUC18907.1 hypothetical protein UV8b_03148 [Ustilaginoidea virens]GAO17036.1 hypothetical protein UVI_02021900 [Ustilaginoidea virens]
MASDTEPDSKSPILAERGQESAPPWSYAHLELFADGPQDIVLDEITVKLYCTDALTQFLGLTGQAISVDILKAQGSSCWLRLPPEDMSRFAAAITAYGGKREGDTRYILRIKRPSDRLGVLVGRQSEDDLVRS